MLGELESWMGLIDGLWQSTICPRLSGQISKMTMMMMMMMMMMMITMMVMMMMMMMMDDDDDHDDGDDDDIGEVEFQKCIVAQYFKAALKTHCQELFNTILY